jgi:hypothetical protein
MRALVNHVGEIAVLLVAAELMAGRLAVPTLILFSGSAALSLPRSAGWARRGRGRKGPSPPAPGSPSFLPSDRGW